MSSCFLCPQPHEQHRRTQVGLKSLPLAKELSPLGESCRLVSANPFRDSTSGENNIQFGDYWGTFRTVQANCCSVPQQHTVICVSHTNNPISRADVASPAIQVVSSNPFALLPHLQDLLATLKKSCSVCCIMLGQKRNVAPSGFSCVDVLSEDLHQHASLECYPTALFSAWAVTHQRAKAHLWRNCNI